MTILVVWAAITLMFILLWAMPGDAVSIKSQEKSVNAATQHNLRVKYGLDKPMVVQYGTFLSNLVRGDLGYSIKNDHSVNKDFHETAATSLRLLFWGGTVEILGSLGLGFLAAAKRGSKIDSLSTVLSIGAQAIPVFATGLLAQLFFGVFPHAHHMDWLAFNTFWPQSWRFGIIPNGGWKGLVLPSIVVAIVEMAFLARLLRSSMLEVMRADYVRTAFAKGLPKNRVLIKHAMRNALIPYVTAASLALVNIFGIAVQTETVFGIYGLGSKIAEAAEGQDTPVVLGLSSLVILAAALVSLLVDLSYSILDPRIRVGEKINA